MGKDFLFLFRNIPLEGYSSWVWEHVYFWNRLDPGTAEEKSPGAQLKARKLLRRWPLKTSVLPDHMLLCGDLHPTPRMQSEWPRNDHTEAQILQNPCRGTWEEGGTWLSLSLMGVFVGDITLHYEVLESLLCDCSGVGCCWCQVLEMTPFWAPW